MPVAIDFQMFDAEGEGYLDRQMIATEMQTRTRILERDQRKANALAKNGQQDLDLEISLGEQQMRFAQELISFLGMFVTAVDGAPVSWNNEEDQPTIRRALRRASKAQIDQLLDLVRGVTDVPKQSDTA